MMQDYRIWNAESCKDLTRDDEVKHLGVAALYLGIAADLASDCYYKSAWSAAKIADRIGYSGDSEIYNILAYAVKMFITYHMDRHWRRDEFYYQYLFKKYASIVVPGCEVIKKGGDSHNQPDAWVEIDGEVIPIEVKLNSFNENALQQLNRYIKAFGAKKGIAVGRTLNVELPDNITFISNDTLDELDAERKITEQRDSEFVGFINETIEKTFEGVE